MLVAWEEQVGVENWAASGTNRPVRSPVLTSREQA